MLVSHPAMPFGVSGEKWLLSFSLQGVGGFYGMGEKNIGFEKSQVRTRFWNTDVWADFAAQDVEFGTTDPMYASFPVLILNANGHWLAIILPGSYPAFMDTGAKQVIEGVQDSGADLDFFYLGSKGSTAVKRADGSCVGMAQCIIAAAEDMASLIPKVNRIAGLPQRFPLWALGYHQSRWGYSSLAELEDLSEEFSNLHIPCDGLWLDIDYMHEYRVFTLNHFGFDNIESRLAELYRNGRRVVPILDPGMKREDGNSLVNEAMENELFCQNSAGTEYTGFVWPGASYFPDFSLDKTRTWWARESAALALQGFSGFWVDMNDPSTGASCVDDMRFNHGQYPHEAYRNDYARDMTRATSEGLRKADPGKRPFVLSRSGSLGSSRWGALWTGDSMSNYHHLNKGIEMILSLSLSGMPMVGMDVGGFGGDCTDELAVDWHRASFLLPIFRNHSAADTKPQEPWRFNEASLGRITQAIRARYSLLPYLYQQMIKYSSKGESIVRPMLYHEWSEATRTCSDQYYIGPQIFQAPKLEEGQKSRNVVFPSGEWAGLFTHQQIRSGQISAINLLEHPFPVFIKAGAVIPIQGWDETINSSDQVDLRSPSFLIYPGKQETDWQQSEISEYVFDDSDGWGYMLNDESLRWTVCSRSGQLEIQTECQKPQTGEYDLYVFGERSAIRLNGETYTPTAAENPLPGSTVPVWKVRIPV
ncbi:TIM-barrel domain-containing protein [Spirochaeta dissipatitropha]